MEPTAYIGLMNDPSPHILVVDDDREIRDLTARFLRKHGFRVDDAANGKEMDSHLTDGSFDLIVLDLMMPGEDGLSICRRLRADTAIPIIMLTALGEETDRIVGLEIGGRRLPAQTFQSAGTSGTHKSRIAARRRFSEPAACIGTPVDL